MRSIMLPLHVPTSQSKQFTLMFAYKTAQNDKQHFNDFFSLWLSGSLALRKCKYDWLVSYSFRNWYRENNNGFFFPLFHSQLPFAVFTVHTSIFPFMSRAKRLSQVQFSCWGMWMRCQNGRDLHSDFPVWRQNTLSLSLYPVTSTTCNIASRWWLSAVIRMLAIWMLSSRILFLFLSSDSETRIKKTVHGQRGARLFFPFNFIAIYRTDDGRKMEFFFCSTFCLAHIARVHGNGFHWEKSMLQFNSRRTKFWWLEVVDVQMKCERHQTRLIDI